MSTIRPGAATPPPRPAVPPVGTNLAVLRGTLSRDPERRPLPSGDDLARYEVTVPPGAGAPEGARAESVPVTWFDPPVTAGSLQAGDDVVVVGRVRRRFFRAGATTASRTEVVAAALVPARAPARVGRALAAALADLEPG